MGWGDFLKRKTFLRRPATNLPRARPLEHLEVGSGSVGLGFSFAGLEFCRFVTPAAVVSLRLIEGTANCISIDKILSFSHAFQVDTLEIRNSG